MWGNAKIQDSNMLEAQREMYTSKRGNKIIYNKGGKDNFQVSIIECDTNDAYAMRDVDYFEVILKYSNKYEVEILSLIRQMSEFIDQNAGGFYDSFIGLIFEPNEPFDINNRNTFGYNDQLHINNIINIVDTYDGMEIEDPESELEEALVIIYLAMVSEWYYGFSYGGIDSGKRSKWQHRMKILGLHQVINRDLTPECAARYSIRLGEDQISDALEIYGIYSKPLKFPKK
ncbi:hypothetical protein H9L01_05410 [Erysipelothrix inopinata]|uniref:Uncharacterized protein n=1 Tax=Erysipelothrix inopinata TaxID=225084 RepID=A0A7G9RW56_9FIRM|nr:hypothetical protein [Erysipelothrix inopinata]QNN59831.1 hypothetical protein H9L01_05410 [Erysipelothrix inopinata]